jgi:hypothetical protein
VVDERTLVLDRFFGEGQNGRVDIGEVLVEGCRSHPDLACDVDDFEVEHTVALEGGNGCVEQPPSGGERALADHTAVGGLHLVGHPRDDSPPGLTARQTLPTFGR